MKEIAVQEKRDFIIIPGTSREKSYFNEFCQALKASPVCQDICLIDNLGFGEFAKKKSPWRIKDFVNHSQKTYFNQEISDSPLKKTIIGHSLGAGIAFAWANQNPTLFSEYILVNGTIGTFNLNVLKRGFAGSLSLAFAAISFLPPKKAEEWILKYTVNNPKRREELLSLDLVMQRQPVSPLDTLKQAFAALSFFPLVMPTKASGLILYSKNDRFIPALNSKKMAQKLGLATRVHPTAGHDLIQEDPRYCVEAICDFITNKR